MNHIPLKASNGNLPPFAQAAGAVIDAAMACATIRAMPVAPDGDDFRARKQDLLRLAQAADKLAAMLIDDAHGNTNVKFPICASPMNDALLDDVYGCFEQAAEEADEAHSLEAAKADEGDRKFHERGL